VGGLYGFQQQQQQQQQLFTLDEVQQMIQRAVQQHEQEWRQQQQLFTLAEVQQMIDCALQQYQQQQQQQQRSEAPSAASLTDDAAAIAAASAAAAAAAAAAGPSFVPDVMAKYQQPFLTQHPGLAAALGARTNVQPGLQENGTTALVHLISASCIAGSRQATAEALGLKPAAAAAATIAAARAAATAADVEPASGPQPPASAPPKKVPDFSSWVSLYHLEKWYTEVG
jgi:hypothetical protein